MASDTSVHRGQVLGDKYVLGDLLGAGGMGQVYAAEQPSLGRTVAVKVLRPELSADPHVLRRFHAEAVVGSRLAHRNVVAVFDFGTTPTGMPYLVMEYVRGQGLAKVLASEGPLPVHRASALVGQVLCGLAEAHAYGIVHADVKTDNVLVERLRDGEELVKLVDFGLARFLEDAAPGLKETMLSGTPEYLAPEVIRGGAPSPASDVYGAGVILYELMTGTTPFGGGTSSEILARHLEEDVVPPSLRNPDSVIPPGIEAVVLRALEKVPHHRYADAGQFGRALAAAVPPPVASESQHEPDAFGPSLFSTEAPTRSLTRDKLPVHRRARVPGGAHVHGRRRASRHALGDAIERGDIHDIVAGYLELARTLVDKRLLTDAVTELEEAVNLLTFGGGPEASDAPEPVWRVLLTLAALYDGVGDPVRARRVALAAREQASRHQNVHGEDRAQALIDRLVRGPHRSP